MCTHIYIVIIAVWYIYIPPIASYRMKETTTIKSILKQKMPNFTPVAKKEIGFSLPSHHQESPLSSKQIRKMQKRARESVKKSRTDRRRWQDDKED